MKLHHLVKTPREIKDKNPLLLLIHGYGSNEEDLFSFATQLPESYYIISIRAPYELGFGGFAWYAINFDADENKFSDLNQARSSRDLIVECIDECIAKYPIDANDITTIGFSQGAILSLATALSYPNKIARVCALSGYFNPEICVSDYKIKSHKGLKFFVSHGTSDQVIPVEWARKTKPALEALQLDVLYKEYPVGHGVAPQNFFDMLHWLTQN